MVKTGKLSKCTYVASLILGSLSDLLGVALSDTSSRFERLGELGDSVKYSNYTSGDSDEWLVLTLLASFLAPVARSSVVPKADPVDGPSLSPSETWCYRQPTVSSIPRVRGFHLLG